MKNNNYSLVLLLFAFCSLGYSKSKKLKIVYSEYSKISNVENEVFRDSIVTTRYVELELKLMADGGYICSNNYMKAIVAKDSLVKYSRGIRDMNGEFLLFLMEENFFNYLDERGYEFLFRDEKKYGARYVFKKI